MGIFEKFKLGLQKTASSFSSGLKEIIIKKEIDDKTLDEIEEFLIQSDVGVTASEEIKKIIAEKKIDPNKDKLEEINLILKNYIISLMSPLENSNFFSNKTDLNAVLVSGVNGVGKTTTIGKIGKILKNNGNKVIFSASDTFRAAAIEQLENWAKKIDVDIIKSSQGSDPASVAYKAIEEAIGKNFTHVLIADYGVRLLQVAPLLAYYDIDPNIVKFIGTGAWDDVIFFNEPSLQNAIFPGVEYNKREGLVREYATFYDEDLMRISTLPYDLVGLLAFLINNKITKPIFINFITLRIIN